MDEQNDVTKNAEGIREEGGSLSAEPAGIPAQNEQPKEGQDKKKLILIGLGAAVLLVGGMLTAERVGWANFGLSGMWMSDSSVENGAVNGEPVAMVNGEAITRGEFDQVVDRMHASQAMFGQEEPLSEEMKLQVLDQMIEERLLLQDAAARGIQVSDEEVDEAWAEIEAELGDQLHAQLDMYGLTEEQARKNIREQLLMQNYFAQLQLEFAIEVTDQEMRDVYDEFVAGEDGAPSFEEMEADIRQFVTQQKGGEMAQTILMQLREDAEIEILL